MNGEGEGGAEDEGMKVWGGSMEDGKRGVVEGGYNGTRSFLWVIMKGGINVE